MNPENVFGATELEEYNFLNKQNNQEGAMRAKRLLDNKLFAIQFRDAAICVNFNPFIAVTSRFLETARNEFDARKWPTDIVQDLITSSTMDLRRLVRALTLAKHDVENEFPLLNAAAPEVQRDTQTAQDGIDPSQPSRKKQRRFRFYKNLLVNRRHMTSRRWLPSASRAYNGDETDDEGITERDILVAEDGSPLDEVWDRRATFRNIINAFFRLFNVGDVHHVETVITTSIHGENSLSSRCHELMTLPFTKWRQLRDDLRQDSSDAIDDISLHCALSTVTLETWFDHVYGETRLTPSECIVLGQLFVHVEPKLPARKMSWLRNVAATL